MTPFDPYAYLDAASTAIALPVPPARRDAVAANITRLAAMAADIIDFPLSAPPGGASTAAADET